MRTMTPEERETHVEAMRNQRIEIQATITEVARERDAFLREAMKKQALDDSKAFDSVVRQAVRRQAIDKGFRFADMSVSKE